MMTSSLWVEDIIENTMQTEAIKDEIKQKKRKIKLGLGCKNIFQNNSQRGG